MKPTNMILEGLSSIKEAKKSQKAQFEEFVKTIPTAYFKKYVKENHPSMDLEKGIDSKTFQKIMLDMLYDYVVSNGLAGVTSIMISKYTDSPEYKARYETLAKEIGVK